MSTVAPDRTTVEIPAARPPAVPLAGPGGRRRRRRRHRGRRHLGPGPAARPGGGAALRLEPRPARTARASSSTPPAGPSTPSAPTGSSSSTVEAELTVTSYPADSYDSYVTDREHIVDPPAPGQPIQVLGRGAQMWAYTDDDHTAIREVEDGRWIELAPAGRGRGGVPRRCSGSCASPRRTSSRPPCRRGTSPSPSALLRRPRSSTDIEAVSGAGFPAGDAPSFADGDSQDRYQFGAEVAGAYACAWLEAFENAVTHDQSAARRRGRAVLGTSEGLADPRRDGRGRRLPRGGLGPLRPGRRPAGARGLPRRSRLLSVVLVRPADRPADQQTAAADEDQRGTGPLVSRASARRLAIALSTWRQRCQATNDRGRRPRPGRSASGAPASSGCRRPGVERDAAGHQGDGGAHPRQERPLVGQAVPRVDVHGLIVAYDPPDTVPGMTDSVGRPGMVDWDLAVRIGSRIAGDGPTVTRDEATAAVAELRAGADRSTGLVREFTGLAAAESTAPVLVVDRAGWVQANADAFATILGPVVDKLNDEEAAERSHAGDRLEDHRRRGRRAARLPGQQGAGPVRPVPRPRRAAAAGGAQHRARRARARRRPDRLPAVGLPARGDPPRAVHRGAVDARPPVRRDPASSPTPMEPSGLLDEGGLSRIIEALKGAKARPGRRSLLDVVSTPEQKELIDRMTGVMSLLEGHADVVMDGVGPTVIPTVGKIRGEVQRAPQGRRRARQGAAPAARPRRQDGAVPRRRDLRPARRRRGRHGAVQRRVGAPRAPARPRPRSRTRRPG